MPKRPLPQVTVKLDKIVGGGQALGTLDDGRKIFVWGALPGETALVQVTRKKSSFAEGVVEEILEASPERIEPVDPDSYLSTSPWQVMDMATEQRYKAALIEEAFELHDVVLPHAIEVYADEREYKYRNKVEFSFWHDKETGELSLAFFRRGTHGKIKVEGTTLAMDAINEKATEIVAKLNELTIEGRTLKTVMIRCDQNGATAWQLYVKDEDFKAEEFLSLFDAAENGEVIFSNPKSPASVITKRLAGSGAPLKDTIRGTEFQYATESFFQVNIPVYEKALADMQIYVTKDKKVVDLYSGVGTIGLTIGGAGVTLVELNEAAVDEMERNIQTLGVSATAVLAPSEQAIDFIVSDKTIIVDPPRAGLHAAVVERLLEQRPERIIYLSCNPVTQARDVELLGEVYGIKAHQGYDFFPHTPHIEHLVILDLKPYPTV